jgi:hypothetical protein
MKRAYEHHAKKLWILNAGDIKPAEYLTEFFMDMAWNINAVNDNIFTHLEKWAEREFGKQNANAITSVMKEYYRLANIRKPEFTGWSRVEEYKLYKNKYGLSPVADGEFSPTGIQRRVSHYNALENQVAAIKKTIPDRLKNAYFELVEYPVRSASLINQKWLYWQQSDSVASLNAYNLIDTLTKYYNVLQNGKWRGIMDSRPRNLPVFAKPEFPENKDTAHYNSTQNVFAQNADHATNLKNKGIEGLGHSFSAVEMRKGQTLDFVFDIPEAGEYTLKIGTIPNHDVDGEGMKIEVLLNDKTVNELDYSVEGRSETWKQNVLRGQAISSVRLYVEQAGKIKISVKALTNYIVLDQIMLSQSEMNFYEFPVKTKSSRTGFLSGLARRKNIYLRSPSLQTCAA